MKKTASLARYVALVAAAATVSLLIATSAHAKPRKVYLNGEDLGDVLVRNHTFKGCIVRFDGNGNVYITAPNLEIKTKPLGRTPGKVRVGRTLNKVAKFGQSFYLVSKPIHQGTLVPYRFSVYVNGKRVAIIDPKGAQAVHTVTHLIRKGTNTVRISPLFRASSKITRSPRDRFRIVIGAGVINKGTVMIHNPVVVFERNGTETGKFTKVFRFTTR